MEEGFFTPPHTPDAMDHNQTPSESLLRTDDGLPGAPRRPLRVGVDYRDPPNHRAYRRLNFY